MATRTRFIFCRHCENAGNPAKLVKKGDQCPDCGTIALNENHKHFINTAIKCRDWSQVNKDCPLKPTGTFTMLGQDYERPVSSDADVQRIYDQYNRDHEGERYAKPFWL